MILRILGSTLAVLFLSLPTPASAQFTVRDDAGRGLVVKKHATRIVTLAPFLTEIAFAAGLGDLVVGVDTLSEYPPQVKDLPRVAVSPAFSLDSLAVLKPDLVLVWRDGFRPEDVDRIEKYGATVYVGHARQLEDVPRLLTAIASLAGRDAGAAAAAFETQLEAVRRANASKPRVNAFVEIWNRPLTTVSGQHVLSEALEICRADNIFRERLQMAPQVSIEDVRGRNPDVIVGAGSAGSAVEFYSNWAIRSAIPAVQQKRLVYVDIETIQRPTPRTPEGIAQLCAEIDTVRAQVAQASLPRAPGAEPAPAPATPKAAVPQPPPTQPAAPSPRPSGRPSQYGM